MKKVFFLMAISMLGLSSANAQDIDVGIKGGLNFANISGDGIDADSRTGFHAGLTLEVSLLKTFALQPELLYSTQGAKSGNEEFKLDYISIPILAKYYIVPSLLSIDVGPQFSFLINDNADEFLGAVTEADTSSFDLGAAFGLGAKTPFGLFAQARYVLGITTVSENPDVNNNVFQLSVGYNF
ncbi:porin family protein [Sungkyunkwania multivorans]|uniref:Porin family protein n=1 Tax=Sungkyunkwania multivorans TaxID=1173618 RepID=A0ABW3CTQ9_9FLAO